MNDVADLSDLNKTVPPSGGGAPSGSGGAGGAGGPGASGSPEGDGDPDGETVDPDAPTPAVTAATVPEPEPETPEQREARLKREAEHDDAYYSEVSEKARNLLRAMALKTERDGAGRQAAPANQDDEGRKPSLVDLLRRKPKANPEALFNSPAATERRAAFESRIMDFAKTNNSLREELASPAFASMSHRIASNQATEDDLRNQARINAKRELLSEQSKNIAADVESFKDQKFLDKSCEKSVKALGEEISMSVGDINKQPFVKKMDDHSNSPMEKIRENMKEFAKKFNGVFNFLKRMAGMGVSAPSSP